MSYFVFEPCLVYILKCNDGSYYVGHTNIIELRIIEHFNGVEHYTSARLPVILVYAKEFETRDEAFRFERQIKGWSRRKKEALIEKNFERLSQFASRSRQFKNLIN